MPVIHTVFRRRRLSLEGARRPAPIPPPIPEEEGFVTILVRTPDFTLVRDAAGARWIRRVRIGTDGLQRDARTD